MLKPLKNTEIVAGAAGSVVLGPPITRFIAKHIQLERMGEVVIPLLIGATGLLIAGRSHPAGAAAFASVQIGYALVNAFPVLDMR